MVPDAERTNTASSRAAENCRGTERLEYIDMQFYLNLGLFRADLRELSSRIQTLKRALGARWTAPMAAEQRELQRLKLRATELCALRAFARGKLHLTKAPLGADAGWDALTYHRRVVERLAPSYAMPLEQSA
jgi:hypothetical protein